MTTLQTIESNVNLAIRNLITTPELDALLSSELENIWLPEVYTTKDVYNANVKAMKKLFYAGRIGTIKNK